MKYKFSTFFSFLGALGVLALQTSFVFGVSSIARAYDMKDNREVSSRKPVNISAFQLIFDRLKGLTLFKGNVKATHDQVTLTADEVRAVSENREATADGKVKVVDPTAGLTMTCGNLEYQDLMNLMTAHDHPLLTSLDENGRPITALGRQMELDSQKKTVVIHQNVQIFHDGGRAEAQKATFLSKEDKFIMEEEPKLTMPNGRLSGRRIVSNLGVGRSIIVEGMADAVFYPGGLPSSERDGGKAPVSVSGEKGRSPLENFSIKPSATVTPAAGVAGSPENSGRSGPVSYRIRH